MLGLKMGGDLLERMEHLNHMNCRTTHKMDDLWVCLADEAARCPNLIIYGSEKYCVHENNEDFGMRSEQAKQPNA